METERARKTKSSSRSVKLPANPAVKTTTHNHDQHLKRVARIKGQMNAIERMLDEKRYCPEILQQIKSVSSALKGLEASVLETHMRGCVKKAMSSRDPFEIDDKLNEVMNLFRSQS